MGSGSKGRILVVGDDMRIFLTVVRSLGRAGYAVHAAPFDWQAPALRSRFIDKVHLLPRYSDDPKSWLQEMAKVIADEAIQVVIPCCDRAILPLDRHRAELGPAIFALPTPQAMHTLFDKLLTKELGRSLGIPMAAGEQLRSDDSAPGLIARYGLPLVVKPKRSYTFDHLTTWGRVHIAESPEQLADVLASIDVADEYLVEAYFKGGFGVGVSVLAGKGEIIQAFQHRRLREGWGGSSSYRISETCYSPLLKAAEAVCSAMKIDGVCMFEFRCRSDGSWILLEVNARLWGSLPLPVGMGVDFPAALCELLLGQPTRLPVPYRAGVRSRNTLLDGFNLLKATAKRRYDSLGALIMAWADFACQPLWWVIGREHSDSFTRDDLPPGFAEIRSVLAKLVFTVKRHPNGRPGDRPAKALPSIAVPNSAR
jgi:predicted ATP-grasp superfamily ATP-dependent carboligase